MTISNNHVVKWKIRMNSVTKRTETKLNQCSGTTPPTEQTRCRKYYQMYIAKKFDQLRLLCSLSSSSVSSAGPDHHNQIQVVICWGQLWKMFIAAVATHRFLAYSGYELNCMFCLMLVNSLVLIKQHFSQPKSENCTNCCMQSVNQTRHPCGTPHSIDSSASLSHRSQLQVHPLFSTQCVTRISTSASLAWISICLVLRFKVGTFTTNAPHILNN